MARTRKRTLVDDLMAEKVSLGGTLMTRQQVVKVMTTQGHRKDAVDYFAFATKARTAEEQEYYRAACQCGCKMLSAVNREIDRCAFCSPDDF